MSLRLFTPQRIAAITIATLLSSTAVADELNAANTAWILTSTALVLFMTIPGLSLFYGGLVRSRNVLSVLMQCFSITCMASLIWLIAGYSLAFGDGGSANAVIGNLDNLLMGKIAEDSMAGDIPESVFAMFQMTFAVITPALIVGAFAERMRFGAMMLFSALWLLAVYVPITHWVWGGGWLGADGLIGLRGRYRSAHYCGGRRTRRRAGHRQSSRLPEPGNAAAQFDHDGDRRGYAMGRLVWF